jgi:hypothetical protein
MNNHDRAHLFGTLLATTLASTAFAMEPTPSGAPSSPTTSLPVFLDVARLPDMQEAWRARFNDADTSQATAATATPVAPDKADTTVLDTSREAISRAEQVSREAAALRSRAEELSRRFTADPNATSDPPVAAAAAAVEQPAPAETASIGQDANQAPAANDQVLAPVDGEFTQVEPAVEVPVKKQAAAADAPVIEDMATVPPMGVTRRPTAPSLRQAAQSAARRAYVPKPVAADATKPDEDPTLPTELRSFGWASQP